MDNGAQKFCRRLGQLRLERAIHESHWSECYKFGAPERQQNFSSTTDNKGQRENERADLYDSTAADSVQVLTSMIMSGVTPANSIWFKAQPDGIDNLSELTEGERWLEDVCQFIWRNIHAANFDSESFETVTDIVTAGWGVLYTDIDREAGGGYVFESWHIGNCFIASTRADGQIDTIYREHEMTAETMINTYGEENCHLQVVQMARTAPDTRYKLLHVIEPRKQKGSGQLNKAMPFASYHIDIANSQIMKESGYHEFPCAIPRLRRLPNSNYGNGQMTIALPDAKMANELMKNTVRAADLQIGGMWIAEDDGVLNPHTVRIGPRKVIIANSVDSMKRLDDGTNFQISEYLLTNLQGGIRKKLMADQLPPVGTQQMTATEIHTRVELIRQMLGPMYGRLQTEYLLSILDRCFGLALRSGALGQPPQELLGRNLSFKFVSPFALAQRMAEVIATEQFVASVGQMASVEPTILDNIDFDAVAVVTGTGRGVPQTIMRTADEVKSLREARQKAKEEQAAQQQQAAIMEKGADALAKNMGGTLGTEVVQ
ncbi:phage head-tail adapter protein [Acinetobacter genomosp. 33YU]|uniref:portal protein n=1 Tax=Acinetobacter genomosp. 33YU TaxID=1675530 RepID=UPI00097F8C12|nr:portal protein [Acinetobacter genomosp. 33YU]ONN50967.1 phage head-tail adapter protein [Acinetobacter genomosp. 33YU]